MQPSSKNMDENQLPGTNDDLVNSELLTDIIRESIDHHSSLLKLSRNSQTSCKQEIYMAFISIIEGLEKLLQATETTLCSLEDVRKELQSSVSHYLKLMKRLFADFKLQISETTNAFLRNLPDDLVKAEVELNSSDDLIRAEAGLELLPQETYSSGNESDTCEIEDSDFFANSFEQETNEGESGVKYVANNSKEGKSKKKRGKLKIDKLKKPKGANTRIEETMENKLGKTGSSTECIKIPYVRLVDCIRVKNKSEAHDSKEDKSKKEKDDLIGTGSRQPKENPARKDETVENELIELSLTMESNRIPFVRCDSKEDKPKKEKDDFIGAESKEPKDDPATKEETVGNLMVVNSAKDSNEIPFVRFEDCENLTCKLCGKSCKDLVTLQKHFDRHKNVYKYKCNNCGEWFQTVVEYHTHLETFHQGSDDLRCPTCKKSYNHVTTLRLHIRTVHDNEGRSTIKGKDIEAYGSEGSSGKTIYTCDECSLVYSGKAQFVLHMNQKHPDLIKHRKQFYCDICNIAVSSKRYLKAHMESQSHLRKRVGQILGYAPLEENLNEYLKEEKIADESQRKQVEEVLGKNKTFICEKCGASFEFALNLRRHRLSSHTFSECKECGRKINRAKMKDHMLTKHSELPTEMMHPCSICSKSFKRVKELNWHIKQFHCLKLRKQFNCHLCHNTYTSKSMLRRHVNTVHGDVKGEPEKAPTLHCCEICSNEFTSKQNLNAHMEREHEIPRKSNQEHLCNACGKWFKVKSQLKQHIEAVHDDKRPFECKICGKAFKWPENLKSHMNMHSGLRPYKCTMCPLAFRSASTFSIHKNIHQRRLDRLKEAANKPLPVPGENEHVCKICGKVLRGKYLLIRHIDVVHSDKRRHECHICGKTYKWPGGLESHLNMHAGVFPYKCPLCPKSFRSSGNLSCHKQVHEKKLGIKIVQDRITKGIVEEIKNLDGNI